MSVVFNLSNIAQIKEKINFVYTRKDGMLRPHNIPKATFNFYTLTYFNTVCTVHCMKLIFITTLTCTKYVHSTLANLQHISAHNRCHHQRVLAVAFIVPSKQSVAK